jgi:asparagine synthase (glutamine-hydrolysing)
MPGVVLAINHENIELLLKAMMNSIKHKDWYLLDSYVGKTFAIGRVHLGILNPETQPIYNEDKSLGIFMDGEIFDYAKEKEKLKTQGHKFTINNDAEFCLHLFEEKGEEFVKSLNGSFIIVIFDVVNEKILIFNDRHGLRPFYYTQNNKKYIFASEVKAILQDKTFEKEIDDSAVAEFFAFDRILEDKTLFKNVKVLPPASIFIITKEKFEHKQYWDFLYTEDYNSFSENYYIQKLVKSFRRAVERRIQEKNAYAVFLSGGLDSRSIVAEARKSHNPIYTFSYSILKGDEAKIAEKVAKKSSTKHMFLKLPQEFLAKFVEEGVYLTDGMANCNNFYWTSSILNRVKKDADIVFHGLGICWLANPGLYFHNPIHRKLVKSDEKFLVDLIYKKLNTLITDEMMPKIFSSNYFNKIKGIPLKSVVRVLRDSPFKHPVNRNDYFILRTYTRYHMGPVLLRSVLEDRIPGFDNDFMDLLLKIPPELRLDHKIYYKFLTSLASDLAKIPYQKTGVPPIFPVVAHKIGFIVKEIFQTFFRKIRNLLKGHFSFTDYFGYPDAGELIRKNRNMRKFFEDILLDKRTIARGYFNKEYMHRIVDDHMNYRKNYGKQLCALMTFELWNRLFIDI